MMILMVVIIAALVAAGLFLGFGSKKKHKGKGLGDPTASNQPESS